MRSVKIVAAVLFTVIFFGCSDGTPDPAPKPAPEAPKATAAVPAPVAAEPDPEPVKKTLPSNLTLPPSQRSSYSTPTSGRTPSGTASGSGDGRYRQKTGTKNKTPESQLSSKTSIIKATAKAKPVDVRVTEKDAAFINGLPSGVQEAASEALSESASDAARLSGLEKLTASGSEAVPVYRRMLNKTDMSPKVLNRLCDHTEGLGADAAQLVDDLIMQYKLTQPGMNTRGRIVQTLGNMGPAARRALPFLEHQIRLPAGFDPQFVTFGPLGREIQKAIEKIKGTKSTSQ